MTRKRVVQDSDDEPASASNQKRSRLDTSPLEPESSPVALRLNGTNKGKGRARTATTEAATTSSQPYGDDDEDDDDARADPSSALAPSGGNQDESDVEYEEDEEEEDRVARAARDLAAQSRERGTVRRAGVMERVQVYNFMCHKNLEVPLGPQTNFIIGRNGSGKSAVLTAITLALGSKASATDRGSALKEFIKEGEQRAEIVLQLGNRGDEAYQPDVYGDTIRLERALNRDGGGGYKIKNQWGKTVTTKRDDLQAMLDHFMIQADNPLNVLSQDAAKQFLAASSPKQMYSLFIRGTQLQHLTEEYTRIGQAISGMKIQLENKRAVIPELHLAAKMAKDRLDDADKASRQHDRLAELQKDLMWAYVIEQEAEAAKAREQKEKEQEKLERCGAEVRAEEQKLREIEAEIVETNDQRGSEDDDDSLERERDEIKAQIRAKSDAIKDLKNETRQINGAVQELRRSLEENQQAIDAACEKAAALNDGSRARADATKMRLQAEIIGIEGDLARLAAAVTQLNGEGRERSERQRELKRRLEEAQKAIVQAQDFVQRVESAARSGDSYAPYGHNAGRLAQAVQNEARRFKEMPLGPLGRYVKVKDRRWVRVLETVLGNLLTSWLVTNREDEYLLRQLMKRTQSNAGILRTRRDLFDYSQGEPDAEWTTILRVLSFDDEFVKRAMINDLHIESAILVTQRSHGDEVMAKPQHERRNIRDCYDIDCYKLGGIVGGRQAKALTQYGGMPRLTQDMEGAMRNGKARLAEAEANHRAALQEMQDGTRTLANLSDRVRQNKEEKMRLEGEVRRKTEQIEKILDDLAINSDAEIAGLESFKRELEQQIAESQQAFEAAELRQQAIKTECAPLVRRSEELTARVEAKYAQDADWTHRIEALVQRRLLSKTSLQHWSSRLALQQEKVDQATQTYTGLLDAITEMLPQVEEVCGTSERRDPGKSSKKLTSEVAGLQKAIKSAESRQGASIEEIRRQWIDATQSFRQAEEQVLSLSNLVKVLHKALVKRQHAWVNFRKHISIRAKMMFVYNLSNRGYTGKLLFNHDKERLEVKVITGDKATATQQYKDTKSLSGGEKSFSTISLLLTLWDAINCPIRCLDEFDVFMDGVNRKVAIMMIMESAKSQNEVQYLFITPQDLQGINPGREVRVHQLAEPERARGALAASS